MINKSCNNLNLLEGKLKNNLLKNTKELKYHINKILDTKILNLI
jgi:hypothetical protein